MPPLHDLATSTSPAALHEACLRFYMSLQEVGTTWLFFHLPPKTVNFAAMLHDCLPDFPLCHDMRWPTRDQETGAAKGCLHMLYPEDPDTHFSIADLWKAAIVSQQALLHFPAGWEGQARLFPHTTEGTRILPASPSLVREVYNAVAMPHRLNMMQMMAIRAAGPVIIPGFPKFYWEHQGGEQATFKVQGRPVV